MADPAPRTETNPEIAFERSDWPLGIVALVFLGIFVVLVIAPFALMWGYPAAVSDVDRSLQVAMPAPRLQIDAPAELAKFRAQESAKLDRYYWVDKQKQIVHIPIEQAMHKVAREGIPGYPRSGQ